MDYTGYELLWLFFLYSFLGWVIETAVATGKQHQFINRGFFNGPMCFIYGFSAVLMTVSLAELRQRPVFLFLGCAVLATGVEWCTGKLLERLHHRRWWDYSGLKWNFDGYICLPYSLLWGLLGTLALRYGNEVLLVVYGLMPGFLGKILIWAAAVISLMDFLTSLAAVFHSQTERTGAKRFRHRLSQWTYRVAQWVLKRVEVRMDRACALDPKNPGDETQSRRCGLTELFWLFLTGALLGDLTETIFCRVTAGVWMSRSSLVWGPFSIVWGLAIAIATALLHRDRNKPDGHIFLVGTVLGGAYEYLCSVFTELVFGKVFWDYSEIPFNLGGRINLLYCFFWGIAAVVWIKGCYPHVSRWLGRIPRRLNVILTVLLSVFMAANIAVSSLALIRYDARSQGAPADQRWEQVMDRFFDDQRMEIIYPNAISR